MNKQITTSICDLKDDKACVVTFTTDDALYRSCLFYNSKFKEYGIKGTAAITLDMIAKESDKNIPNGNEYGAWKEWQELISQGCFGIANHSKSHAYLNNISLEELELEINETRRTLLSKFPGHKILCMANPYVVTNDMADMVIKEQHYSARNGTVGFNTLHPNEYEWYHLNYQLAVRDTKAETMNEWVDSAITNKYWLIELWHGIDGQGWEPASSDICSAHLSYLASKLETVWNGTMDEVTQYIRERQNARVETIVINDSMIKISLKVNMNSSLFNYPLTLKTTLPADWERVKISQDKHMEYASVCLKDDVTYVLYDGLPDAEDIILSKCE